MSHPNENISKFWGKILTHVLLGGITLTVVILVVAWGRILWEAVVR